MIKEFIIDTLADKVNGQKSTMQNTGDSLAAGGPGG
jgi:hypothetical protein